MELNNILNYQKMENSQHDYQKEQQRMNQQINRQDNNQNKNQEFRQNSSQIYRKYHQNLQEEFKCFICLNMVKEPMIYPYYSKLFFNKCIVYRKSAVVFLLMQYPPFLISFLRFLQLNQVQCYNRINDLNVIINVLDKCEQIMDLKNQTKQFQ